MIEFFVAGVPVPQGSKTAMVVGKRAIIVEGRNVKRKDGTYSNGRQRHKAWRKAVHVGAKLAADALKQGPYAGPVLLELSFFLPRPKSYSRRAMPTKKPDIDKLCRSILDSLSGVVYVDDSQIISLRVTKDYAGELNPAGVEICVEEAVI